ncbi:hypothetical protein [Nitratifractor sp.]
MIDSLITVIVQKPIDEQSDQNKIRPGYDSILEKMGVERTDKEEDHDERDEAGFCMTVEMVQRIAQLIVGNEEPLQKIF